MKDTTIYSSVYVGLSNQKFGSAARLRNITKDDAIKKARQIMKAYDWTEATVEAYIHRMGKVNEGMSVLVGDKIEIAGAVLTALSPTKTLRERWITANRVTWKSRIARMAGEGRKNDYSQTVEELKASPYPKDTSKNNGASIAFLFQCVDFNGLFLGDCFPATVCVALKEMKYTANQPLALNLLKLSHHGGHGNISKELLELVDAKDYVICTNDSPPKPAKATIVKIVDSPNYNSKKRFIFNYEKEKYKELWRVQDIDPLQLNFTFPKTESTGYLWEE